ncbi:hypothetical protein CCC_00836 [Paramagnetospirillum magnetotacticum MS-1]|uniref:Glycosyltransferase RgtA/B/C/D-like domain-containing protein n=1 Tax=Paramagnetospirillum magnetotacticum MS-1 TaxID=272627 RepID=A0A0C2YSS8_PARME|nr:hypothetical protein [Paramagnetospirillum magnetotacticum]KIL97775.1 hypothetical protein CCC_00836 [Paramagnetospirillum magnetotacticum MS-1]
MSHQAPSFRFATFAAVALVIVTGAALQSQVAISRDIAYFIYNNARMLAGQQVVGADAPLYFTGLMVSNFILYAPVSALVAMGVNAQAALFTYVFAMFAPAGLALYRHYSQTGRQPLAMAMTSALAVMAFVFPIDMFGQREHFFFLLLVPYAVYMMKRLDGPDAAFASPAVIACTVLAILIKPHFVFAPAAAEIVAAWREGKWRAPFNRVVLAIAITSSAYYGWALSTMASDPNRQLAVQLNQAYFYHPFSEMIFRKYSLLWVGTAGAWMTARLFRRTDFGTDLWPILWLGALGAALVQQKGVDYHFLPATAFALLASVHAAGVSPPGRRRTATALLVAAFIVLAGWRGQTKLRDEHAALNQIRQLEAAVLRHAGDRPFLLVSTDHWPLYPILVRTGLIYASRFNTFWFIDSLAAVEARRGPVEGSVHRALEQAVVEDFQRYRPRLAVLRRDEEPELTRFLTNPPISGLLARYREVEDVDGFRFLIAEGD